MPALVTEDSLEGDRTEIAATGPRIGLPRDDLLGVFTDFKPKFTKRFAKLTEVAVNGIREYVKEVKEGTFPDDDHSYTVNEAEYDKFAAMVAKRKHI